MLSQKQIGTICFAKFFAIISIISIFSFSNTALAGDCGIGSLDTSTNGGSPYYTYIGYIRLDGTPGSYETRYGLTRDSVHWATEFDYGVVYGMAKCSETSGDNGSQTWPESSKSDWLKTPSDTTGGNCWCQATGFTATASDYTSGPQCTTAASSLWVFRYAFPQSGYCVHECTYFCARYVLEDAAFRAGVFGAVPQTVDLSWYDGSTTISGPASCEVGLTFVPPTPAPRTGYVFTGWKIKPSCTSLIGALDTSINGTASGYKNDSTGAYDANSDNADTYGLTVDNTWAVEFSYGVVKGEAFCSTTDDGKEYTQTGNPGTTGGGQYCWCRATQYTPNGENQCTVSSSLWGFANDFWSSDDCAAGCALFCALYVRSNSAFRAAVFGQ